MPKDHPDRDHPNEISLNPSTDSIIQQRYQEQLDHESMIQARVDQDIESELRNA